MTGTPRLDRRFPPPVGRIQLRAGTTHAPTLKAMDRMLDAFAEQARWDLLLAIKSGKVHPLFALNLWRQQRVNEIPEARVVPDYKPLGLAWAETRESPSHQRAVAATFRRLAPGTIGDLPSRLQSVRDAWTHRTWNMAREHVAGFLRDELGPEHPTYRAVRGLRPWPKSERLKGRPRTVEEARAIALTLGGLPGRMWWTLCLTGMRNIEYWGDGWSETSLGVAIPTGKKRGKLRTVPRIAPLVRPVVGERWFRRLLAKAGDGATPYDARRTFARWMEEAGIIKTNRDAYMGHGPRTVGDLYTQGELPGQLVGDAATMRSYIGENPALMVVA